jgi:hypothetical protein
MLQLKSPKNKRNALSLLNQSYTKHLETHEWCGIFQKCKEKYFRD